jgi:hypothetical protein
LGVGGAVMWRWLRVGAARSRRHANEALVRGVAWSRCGCPTGCRRTRGGVGRSQVIHVGWGRPGGLAAHGGTWRCTTP